MKYQFTPAAERAVAQTAAWLGRNDCEGKSGVALLLALLDESECRAALMLAQARIDAAVVRARWPLPPIDSLVRADPAQASTTVFEQLAPILQAASERLPDVAGPLLLATEHLLLGLAAAGNDMSAWLGEKGISADRLEAEIRRLYDYGSRVEIEPAAEPAASASTATETVPVLRILDAAGNRAREGLRVVEDYVRFVLDDAHLTGRLKRLRHDLVAALGRLPATDRLAARETQADVGVSITTPGEQFRGDTAGVLAANLARLQESLRTLEEFGKLLDVRMAAELEQLRYQAYTLERAVAITGQAVARLARVRLCVLLDAGDAADDLRRLAQSLIEAGVGMIQLRDKRPDDRRLLARTRLLRTLTAGTPTLLVVNDRPDLARLADADGVHVGQEDLTVKDCRTIVGPRALVGLSTHSIEQARQAVLDGADYIGVGPTFPSGTKHFEQFPGIGLLCAVAAEIRLPAFAIGGINRENLTEVLATGIGRVAMSGGILAAANPAATAQEIAARLAQIAAAPSSLPPGDG